MTVPDPVAYCPECPSKGEANRIVPYASATVEQEYLCVKHWRIFQTEEWKELVEIQGGNYMNGDIDPRFKKPKAKCSCGHNFDRLSGGLEKHKVRCGGKVTVIYDI